MANNYKNIRIIVFDFDGTLVDSQSTKLAAYYELFPDDPYHHGIITGILANFPEHPRHEIISKILLGLDFDGDFESAVASYSRIYGKIVLDKVKNCPEKPGATALLKAAYSRYTLFLNSNTPGKPLNEIVSQRGWRLFFQAIFGYPYGKESALTNIMVSKNALPDQVLVVGDGDTDRMAAQQTNCLYYPVFNDNDLIRLGNMLDLFC